MLLVADRIKLEVGSFGQTLTPAQPVTVATMQTVASGPAATPPLSYGIARDGIALVSFTAAGRDQTVPIKNNGWFYEGYSNVLSSITVNYANGTTRTVSHRRA